MTTIFVADDDDDFRSVLRDELVLRGCDVMEARDGTEVLDAFAMASEGLCAWPDALILDVRMPGFSGIGVLEAIRDLPNHPPAVVVTGLAGGRIDRAFVELGAYRVFRKPVALDELIAAVLEAAQVRRDSVAATEQPETSPCGS